MAGRGFALFDTPIGRCGVAWSERGIVAVQLPERRDADTRARLLRRLPGGGESVPPPAVERAVAAIRALLAGGPDGVADVVLDMEGVPAFDRRVYEAARTIPPGTTASYGDVAARIGGRRLAREVGQALGRNPFAIVVPCHRVVAAGGLGGFSARGGPDTKRRLLALERRAPGARAPADGFAFDADVAVARLRAADPGLARVIDDLGPFAMQRKAAPTLFLALAEAIVHQQLTGRAAATIFGRVCALGACNGDGLSAEGILSAADDDLRAAGLSQAKLLALRDLARRTVDGALPTLVGLAELPDDEVITRVTAVRGVGRWTAEMLLMFRLGRPDVLPVDDLGIRGGFAVAFRKRALPTPADVARRGMRWAPYRTVASWYLWRALELARQRRAGG